MSISMMGRSVMAGGPQTDFFYRAGAPPAVSAIDAFSVSQRRFGENFDCSTHAAVIKMMMMTLGQRLADMFDQIQPSGDGYSITMKDEFKVHLSRHELSQAAQASRFTGEDGESVATANVVFAAFVKRKQLTGGYSTFEAALARTIEGETAQRCMQGMGVFGLSSFVPVSELTGKDAVGVLETHNRGAALVNEGVLHDYGEQRHVDRGYGYTLFNDKQSLPNDGWKVTHVAASTDSGKIWDGFYQGVQSNCVTVSAIKAAIIRFGQVPSGIYKHIQVTEQGFDVLMRDSFRVQLTHDEVRQAAAASTFRGTDPQLLDYANFLYAVSAKRAQWENNDFRGRQSYSVALETLNDGEHPGEALRRLGLYGYLRESTVEALAGGAVGTLADSAHSVAVINGTLDLYGLPLDLASSRWMRGGLRALTLV